MGNKYFPVVSWLICGEGSKPGQGKVVATHFLHSAKTIKQ